MIQANIKTPGAYIDINLNAQRTGLPANLHKVLFVTADDVEMDAPVIVYDKSGADAIFGQDSQMGRMITAAIKTNRTVGVQGVGKPQGE